MKRDSAHSKPHIKFVQGMYQCTSRYTMSGVPWMSIAYGETPKEAYDHWSKSK